MARVGVYVQVPFCQTKCTYCNFHTGVFSAGLYSPYVGGSLPGDLRSHGLLYRKAGIEDVPDAVVDTVVSSGAERPALWTRRVWRKYSMRLRK